MASRATVMTGMYEYKTGCNFMHGPLEKEIFEKSYPVLLGKSGYKVGFAGKWGFRVVSDNKNLSWKEYFDSWGGEVASSDCLNPDFPYEVVQKK